MTTTMNECDDNVTSMEFFYDMITNEMWSSWDNVVDYFEYQPWIFSILGSTMVGLSGVLPLFVIPIEEGANLKHGAGAKTLKLLLSFAVGGLLGDVFLHLLPEAWSNRTLNITSRKGHPSMLCGMWVLTGFLVFIIAEKLFIDSNESGEDCSQYEGGEKVSKQRIEAFLNNHAHNELENNNSLSIDKKVKNIEKLSMNLELNRTNKINYISTSIPTSPTKNGFISSVDEELYNGGEMEKNQSFSVMRANGSVSQKNNVINSPMKKVSSLPILILKGQVARKPANGKIPAKPKHISGYLNLLANCIDNFTHGLAVGGSFLVSFRLGALTTFAILIHEIPHEVGDFAILLKSGFNRWDAARAQLLTASGGIFGALIAVLCSGSGVESRTSWILPFTAGGFLHIGLVTILPELLKESNPKESIKQLGALLSGITVMAILTLICD
ncbi:zinc transporter ZIP13 homolog [Chelonus insularis]|uniref:zinc transporter ZIP13 homolog n=1 Tax=Chelonus insularis TaxID=460826 RepID=UPI00158DD70F|nr:zinc transporter ZIP13 homolog [Chelonus insularis]